ncbi:MAG: hypothetical protein E7456_04910 [Ruminococcaceae bacterium]|nr:hypothetical protein [Oscillospiraceae bacterium]
MNKKTRVITTSALFIGLNMVFLYLSSVFPTMQLCFVGVTSLFIAAQVIENGIKGGLYVFAGSCILGFIIVPDKTSMILFALFFGYYPMVKSIAERYNKAIARWAVKLAVMTAAMAVILVFFGELIFDLSQFKYGVWVFAAVFELAFILFDIGMSRLIDFYMMRIHRKGNKT